MLIRDADPAADAAACAAIYAVSVTDGVASLEERAPDAAEMAGRMEAISARFPWLIAELEGGVAGYAYGSRHHPRSAYRWTVDVSVYVSEDHHRRGVGRALYAALLALLAEQGFHVACAGITLPGQASVALHDAFGFRPVGVYRSVGFKHGAWRDVGWYQAELRAAVPGEAPAEIGPPPRLRR